MDRALTAHPLRLTTRHFPSLVTSNDDNQTRRRRCYVCSNTERHRMIRAICVPKTVHHQLCQIFPHPTENLTFSHTNLLN